jgi:plasmid stabilization system protein ParE
MVPLLRPFFAMCYSAQIKADYLKFVRTNGASLSLEDFFDLFWRRAREASAARIPKAMEALFAEPSNDDERWIKALIDEFNAAETQRLEQELFNQKKRLADAKRSLQVSAAGHDRCIIPIRPEHVDAWLNPDPANLAALHVILNDRERPYYEHRLVA